jgi:hypothetical protein
MKLALTLPHVSRVRFTIMASKISARRIVAAGALFLGMLVSTAAARADVTADYSFTGTFSKSGISPITGTFTVDFTNATIPTFSFASPFGTIDATYYAPSLSTIIATDPAGQPFVRLSFVSSFNDLLILQFATSLSAFETDASTPLYTPLVQGGGGGGSTSDLFCNGSADCSNILNGSFFADGTATLLNPSTGVPEPATFAILGTALVGLALALRKLR